LVSLVDGSLPEVRMKYPHLMPEDTAIWTQFLAGGKFLPDVVWYDVRVGQAIKLSDIEPSWMRKYALASTRKRIDVVGRKGLDYWVIECKPGASYAALGQVIYYSRAFAREFSHQGEVVPMIVTDAMDLDLKIDFEEIGVVVAEVG